MIRRTCVRVHIVHVRVNTDVTATQLVMHLNEHTTHTHTGCTTQISHHKPCTNTRFKQNNIQKMVYYLSDFGFMLRKVYSY